MVRLIFAAAVALVAAPAVAGAQDLDAIARAGWPAVSRQWSGTDYLAAGKVLSEGRAPLPRLSDPEGAALVMRMVAPENLDAFRGAGLSAQARLPLFVAMVQGMGQVLDAYIRVLNAPGDRPHEECARLMGFLLRLAAEGVDLVDEAIPSIPRDETYATRMAGLKQFRAGLAGILLGAEVSLGETKVYTQADLAIIVDGMAASLPRIRTHLSRDVVIELRRKLERHRQRFAGEDGAKLDVMVRLLAEQEADAPAGEAPAPRSAPASEVAPSRG